MTTVRSSTHRHCSRRRGFTLAETVVSVVLVGMVLVAALNTVGASKLGQFKVSVRREGNLLAQDLMAEVLLNDYEEPVDTPDFGLESPESGDARTDWDDVDDYDGWSSSPPEYKDGTQIANLNGWERSVAVVRTDPSDLSLVVGNNQGVKRITVTVTHNDVPVAELVALKTTGLPPLEACCFDDGTCEDLHEGDCLAATGTAQGPDTKCASRECPTGPAILFVVTDDANPTVQELARQALIESWGFSLRLISDDASQGEFDAAVAEVDAAYISVEIAANDLRTKLTAASIGVVNANVPLMDDLGYYSGAASYASLSVANVVDNTHFITSTFAPGTLTLSTSDQWFVEVVSGLATGAQVLATIGADKDSLFVVESGAQLVGGTPAPARRVQLPWGDVSVDFSALTEDARTIMRRAIEWAAGADDGDALGPATDCGDGICEVGEDCYGCPGDCASLLLGVPSGRYCCGDGTLQLAEGDGTICDGNP